MRLSRTFQRNNKSNNDNKYFFRAFLYINLLLHKIKRKYLFPSSWARIVVHGQLSKGRWIQNGYREISKYRMRNGKCNHNGMKMFLGQPSQCIYSIVLGFFNPWYFIAYGIYLCYFDHFSFFRFFYPFCEKVGRKWG